MKFKTTSYIILAIGIAVLLVCLFIVPIFFEPGIHKHLIVN